MASYGSASAFCRPCRAVDDVLDGVAASLEELGDVRRDVGVIFDQQQVHDRGATGSGMSSGGQHYPLNM